MTSNKLDIIQSPFEEELVPSGRKDTLSVNNIIELRGAAKHFPRDLNSCVENLTDCIRKDPAIASKCFFTLDFLKDKEGNPVEGPGARMAELARYFFGNIVVEAHVVFEAVDKSHVEIEGRCIDLQSGNAAQSRVKVLLTRKDGSIYNDYAKEALIAGGISKAIRKATFMVVPKLLIDSALRIAKETAVGDKSTLSDRRLKAIRYFASIGVDKSRVLEYLGKENIEDVDLKDLEKLMGTANAIRDGECSPKDYFPPTKKKSFSVSLESGSESGSKSMNHEKPSET